MKIEMRKVFVGISRLAVHEPQHTDVDLEEMYAGIVSGLEPTPEEWQKIEELCFDAKSPLQRYVVELELPFRPTYKDMDVIKKSLVRELKPRLVG